MKKITTGGKIIGALEILTVIGLMSVFVIGYQDIRIERFMEDRTTTFPILCFVSAIFKLVGVISIWAKRKIGVGFYTIGNLILIYFIFTLSLDLRASDELIPLVFLYACIGLQLWFVYIMSKAIRTEKSA